MKQKITDLWHKLYHRYLNEEQYAKAGTVLKLSLNSKK